MLAQSGAYEESIRSYRQALEIEPDMTQAHENLGKLLAQMGQTDEGLRHLQEAMRLNQIPSN